MSKIAFIRIAAVLSFCSLMGCATSPEEEGSEPFTIVYGSHSMTVPAGYQINDLDDGDIYLIAPELPGQPRVSIIVDSDGFWPYHHTFLKMDVGVDGAIYVIDVVTNSDAFAGEEYAMYGWVFASNGHSYLIRGWFDYSYSHGRAVSDFTTLIEENFRILP